MIAALGSEMADGGSVVIALEVIAGTPEVILGRSAAGLYDVLIDIWRRGNIGSFRVMETDSLGKGLSCKNIVVRVGTSYYPVCGDVALVVARPEDKRSMVAQTPDDLDSLFVDHLLHTRIGRICGTAHCKVLPYHDSVLVAEFKESVAFVDVSAPASYHIAADTVGQLKCLFKTVDVV